MGAGSNGELAAYLRDDAATVVARWLERFRTSPVRIPRPLDEGEYTPLVQSIIEDLAAALPVPGSDVAADLRPGSNDVRELERTVTFVGASMVTSGASGFDVAAAIAALRDVIVEIAPPESIDAFASLFEWLTYVALDSYAVATAMSVREKAREELERGTPVLMVAPEVPAALFVGSPDGAAVEAILARLLLQIVRVGASSAILDVGGLSDPRSPSMLENVARFLAHRKIGDGFAVFVVGLDGDDRVAWQGLTKHAALRFLDRFEDAVGEALQRAGRAIVKRSSATS